MHENNHYNRPQRPDRGDRPQRPAQPPRPQERPDTRDHYRVASPPQQQPPQQPPQQRTFDPSQPYATIKFYRGFSIAPYVAAGAAVRMQPADYMGHAVVDIQLESARLIGLVQQDRHIFSLAGTHDA